MFLSFQIEDFGNFFNSFSSSSSFFFLSFPKIKKKEYLCHLKSNHPNFTVNLPMVIIYKFCKKETCMQPRGEPQKQHLGEVQPKSSSYTKFHKRRNDRILDSGAFLQKSHKNFKWGHGNGKILFLVNYSKNVKKLCFFRSRDFNFNLF